MKPLNDIQLHYLQDLEKQIDALGRQITEKRNKMMELLKGRRVTSRLREQFVIERAETRQSGMGGASIYFTGPIVTKTGALHKRSRGSAPYSMIEEIE